MSACAKEDTSSATAGSCDADKSFVISSAEKSFIVSADSYADKQMWLELLDCALEAYVDKTNSILRQRSMSANSASTTSVAKPVPQLYGGSAACACCGKAAAGAGIRLVQVVVLLYCSVLFIRVKRHYAP